VSHQLLRLKKYCVVGKSRVSAQSRVDGQGVGLGSKMIAEVNASAEVIGQIA
jgi:hypothetical protein